MKRYHYYQLISGILFFLMLFYVLFVSERILWLGMLGLVATGFTSVFLANKAGDMKKAEKDETFRNGKLRIYENMHAILTDPVSGKSIWVQAKTERSDNACEQLVWVDKKGNAYGQCDPSNDYEVEFLED